MRWRGLPNATVTPIRDPANGFVGRYLNSSATISWSALQPSTNLAFMSDARETSTTVSGVIGRERNGLFFSQSGRDGGGDG